jgi:hypothetical protein
LENRASLSLKQSPNLISPNKKTAQEEQQAVAPIRRSSSNQKLPAAPKAQTPNPNLQSNA